MTFKLLQDENCKKNLVKDFLDSFNEKINSSIGSFILDKIAYDFEIYANLIFFGKDDLTSKFFIELIKHDVRKNSKHSIEIIENKDFHYDYKLVNSEFKEKLINTDFLFINSLGSVNINTQSNLGTENLFEILDKRFNDSSKRTFISTSLSPEEIFNYFKNSVREMQIFDRLKFCKPIFLDADNHEEPVFKKNGSSREPKLIDENKMV